MCEIKERGIIMNLQMLRGKMVEKGFNVERLSAEIGIDRATLYRKLNKTDKFTIGEAVRIKVALCLTNEEASAIFLP